jgi:hypothetical protein
MIWNYEYTGDLITIYGTRDRFGVSTREYADWPPGVPLLRNQYLRDRFNIANYDFAKPHAILTVRNGIVPFKTPDVLAVIKEYLQGGDWHAGADQFTRISVAYEHSVAEQRVSEMYAIAHALMQYRQDHGSYPTLLPPSAPGNVPWDRVTPSGSISPQPIRNDIPGLFPQYMPRPQSMADPDPSGPGYLYVSDGDNFKLVFVNPPDFPYAKQAHPALIDPVRVAYGVWTSGARSW